MRRAHFLLVPALLAIAVQAAFSEKHNPSQSQIISEIQDKLYHAQVFKHGDVKVGFENGVATLSGTVDSLGVKMDAEHAARKVDDVTSIVDNIIIRAEDVTPRQIGEQARKDILMSYAYGIFDYISLEVRGGRLIVNGQVTQPYKKQDLTNYLAHVKGVAELENNLEVLPTSAFDDSLRLAVARAIYNDPYFLHYANQAMPPIHIIVKDGNVTLEGVVASKMDSGKAEMDARSAATFFGMTNHLQVETK